MADDIHQLKAEESNPEKGSDHSWIPGLILIGLGIFFLANNVFDVDLVDNWWALFILIPAYTKLSRAWRHYRRAGQWTASARGSLIGGSILTLVALIFLFELSWSLFWPLILIILGIGLLLRAEW